ncbi:MAG: GatB/YqeY domain-containing protein [Chloroflexota bacterium]|nr:GatB/YqeY domain-containing protein [Chloroflexota bacterium]
MTLLQRIEGAMHDAMRARDDRRTQTLRMAMAAAHNRRIELRRDLTDDEMTDVLARQVKQRRESVELFRAGGREEMAAKEESEAGILTEFLPAQLDAAELEVMARAAIAETGASSPGEMGKVMGSLAPKVKGRADGRALSELVRRLLSEDSGGA